MTAPGNMVFNFDVELQLKDAGLIGSTDAAQVGGEDKIFDFGNGFYAGTVVIDVTAVEIVDNNELYTVILQGSSSATFASDVQMLAALQFGATEVRAGGEIDSVTGRYMLPFFNHQNFKTYRYGRLYVVVAGTVASGINFSAFISHMPRVHS